MSDPMKNPDRDEEHRRRREMGESRDEPDGRAVADRLYGGPEREPTLDEDGTTEP